MYKYLEITRDSDGCIENRIDISNKSPRSIERIENGMLINLNHDEYSTNIIESSIELCLV